MRLPPSPLHWADAEAGKRVLYVGNLADHVAEVEHDGRGWTFTVLLPGKDFHLERPLPSRSAVEAFVSGVVENWFRAIFA